MKKLLFSVFFVLLFVSVVFAQQSKEDVEKQIKAIFPNFSLSKVTESPIPGLYEIITTDGNIMYWSPRGYMVFGEIWTSTGKSLTAERRQEIIIEKLKNMDTSIAVKVGKGKNKVVTFTDPECPFCKRGYEYFSKRNDVTEHIFFLPFKGETSKKKVSYILCSKDKEKAYMEIMSGLKNGQDVSAECLKKSEETIKKYFETAEKFGIRGTPTYFINGRMVFGANIPLIENMLKQGE